MRKKLITLLLAAGLAFTAVYRAGAVEIKPYGSVDMMFESAFNRGTDITSSVMAGRDAFLSTADFDHNYPGSQSIHKKHFYATQRFILGLNMVASENLSATIDWIAGYFTWGGPATNVDGYHPAPMPGGALGSRAANIAMRQAYLDWTLPSTRIKIRMGAQFLFIPTFATGSLSPVHGGETGTGIVANVPLNQHISLSGGWVRGISDSRRGVTASAGTRTDDNVDIFLLTVPLRFESVKLTPWGGVVLLGKDANYAQAKPYTGNQPFGTVGVYGNGLAGWRCYLPLPAASRAAFLASDVTAIPGRGNSTAYYMGLGGEFTMFDPFRFAFDSAYSAIDTQHREYDRSGWMVGASAEYKTAWGVPTLKAWYASGDDGNVRNGSERPVTTGGFSKTGASSFFAGTASYDLFTDLGNGRATGVWGVSLGWNKLSFIEGMYHNLSVAYIQGTNNKHMAWYADPHYIQSYLTTEDSAWVLGLDTVYSIYKNLAALVEMSYIIPDFDGNLWALQKNSVDRAPTQRTAGVDKLRFSSAWRVAVDLRYTF